ncbi:uncharacterized protein DNG_03085 [Cephalotrichum gorgonifer]|uniref:Fido domain-containing protein n=1 Tax=Cephalotrichum gorgonifer TaxID=2041049 RepID=A0AAE8MVN0_9PEZI|nr:uncharacterized protein DNG_03085 [Cephalotrichum gorgonifer]
MLVNIPPVLARRAAQHHVVRRLGIRCASTIQQKRDKKLRIIYAPLAKLPKDSVEYTELGRSGMVWENYFHPQDSQKLGYIKAQKKCKDTLREIDSLRDSMRIPVGEIAKSFVAEYAHQSVQIEDNRMAPGESHILNDYLVADVLAPLELDKMSALEISQIDLPDQSHLIPNAEPSQVAELRNHLVASRWIAEAALAKPWTSGLDEKELGCLAALTMRDLGRGKYYHTPFGRRVELGHYRSTPIQVRSNPMRIFPYPVEVPECMKRFFIWRDQAHRDGKLHPLILACQAVVYFLAIHPFPDGNGRVSRMMMHDYMVRHGYLPAFMMGLERQDYLKMISDAQDGKPDELVFRVVTTQMEFLQDFKLSEGNP